MRTIRKTHNNHWKPFPPTGPQPSFPWANQLKSPSRPATPTTAMPRPPITGTHNHGIEEHWTAVTAYLASMEFPNEG